MNGICGWQILRAFFSCRSTLKLHRSKLHSFQIGQTQNILFWRCIFFFFFASLLLHNTSQHFCMHIILKYSDKFVLVYFFTLEIIVLRWYLMGNDPLGWIIMYFEDCNYITFMTLALKKVYYSFLCIPWYSSKVVYSPAQPYKVILQFFMENP